MKYVTIYADDSGDPGLKSQHFDKPYFVWGCVAVRDTNAFRSEIRRLLGEVHDSGAYPARLSELKFYPPHSYWKLMHHERWRDAYHTDMDLVRKKTLGIIADRADGVSAMIVDKRDVQGGWKGNTLQIHALYRHFCFGILPSPAMSAPPQMLYDRGRIPLGDQASFHDMVSSQAGTYERQGKVAYEGHIPIPYDADSAVEASLWAADMVAGAFHCKYDRNDPTYADMVATKMICEDIFNTRSMPSRVQPANSERVAYR